MSSHEYAVPVPTTRPSGDAPVVGSEPAPTALVARRNSFTGRVTYVDPKGARALRSRVPRPILASASLMALAVGMGLASLGSPAPGPAPAPAEQRPATGSTVTPPLVVDELPR